MKAEWEFTSEEELRRHLAGAQIPALLMSVAHLTGDTSILRDDWRAKLELLPNGGLPASDEESARELCFHKLVEFRETGTTAPRAVSPELIREIISWAIPTHQPEEMPLLRDVLVLDGEDPRAPRWTKQEIAPDREFRVVIVGAGMSGLLAAYRMKQAGVPFVVYEKSDEIGGTWWHNRYPGVRVDVPSHSYAFSFIPHDWQQHFAAQEPLFEYLRDFAKREGLYEYIRFNVEVTAATWDEGDALWRLWINGSDAEGDQETANVLVSAVGQLSRPSFPDIPGRADFAGPSFHSSQWDHSVDLSGKRVAVIGTGASGVQIIPELAKVARELVIVQRTPPWLTGTPELRAQIDGHSRWLLAHLPHYRAWYRFSLLLPKLWGKLDAATVDRSYGPTESAISAAGAALRDTLTAAMRAQIADAPWLEEHVIPTYPPGAKRLVRDDGTWLETLKRDNVTLVSGGVRDIGTNQITSMDGVSCEVDVIIYATGFRASEFLMPMQVTGRGGVDLHRFWDGDAAAYLGLTVPGFPNMFCLYGPNTGVVVHANLVFFFECQARYLMSAIGVLLAEARGSMSLRSDVFRDYCREINEANALRAWGWSKVSSWYKNQKGRSPIMWPLSTLEYWQRTQRVNPEDYELI